MLTNPAPSSRSGDAIRLRGFSLRILAGWLALSLFLSLAGASQGQTLDEQYLQIFGIIEQADKLVDKGQTNLAKAKYLEAQTALWNFKRANPQYNPKVVAFRLNSVAERITALTPKPADAVATKSGPASGGGETAALPAGWDLKVLNAGGEPRQVLRLHPATGSSEITTLTVKTGMSMGGTEAQSPMLQMPAMKLVFAAQVNEVTDNGDIRYEARIQDLNVVGDAGSLPGAAETMKAALDGIKDQVFSGTTAAQGFSRRVESKGAAVTDPQVRTVIESVKDSLVNLRFALPPEAVGVDARWEVKQKLKTQGMAVDQTSTFTLVSQEGDVLKLKCTVTQQAANQKISNPMMPQLKVDLTSLEGKGTGELTVDLAKLHPKQAAWEVKTDLVMSMGTGGAAGPMKLKTETKVEQETK